MHVHSGGPASVESPEVGDAVAARAQRLAMQASLAVAILMLFGKGAAYYLTGSTAILSDALESVIHLFATAGAAFSLWYASQPPDPEHLYGHGKVAYFSSGFEGALILMAAVGIFVEAGRALVQGPELTSLSAGLAIVAALAAVNLVLGLALVRVGRRTRALVLVANGQHVLTDMWTSLGVLIGLGLVWITGLTWLDPLIAILAGANILWTAAGLLRSAYSGLMETADSADTERALDALRRAVAEDRIVGFHHLRHRRVNDVVWIEVHLLLPDALPLDEAHRRATSVESDLGSLFPGERVQVTSHLEPASHDHPAGLRHETVEDALVGGGEWPVGGRE